ncbi:MAG: hypothetical protein PHG08_00635 [Bacilli bacterium]|nr:hypothetical protein [Bacilli bacterium]
MTEENKTPIDDYLTAATIAAEKYVTAMSIEMAREAYKAAFASAAVTAAEAASQIYTYNANAFINDVIRYMGEVTATAAKNPATISSIMYDNIMQTSEQSCEAYISSLTNP